jgi:competence protein ComEC
MAYLSHFRVCKKCARLNCIAYERGTNRYGHPSPEVLERLKEAGAAVLDTRTGGALTFLSDGKKVRIETYLKP